MEELRLGSALVFALPVVRGLSSEGRAAAHAVNTTGPEAVGLSIAPEEVEALRRYEGGPAEADNFEEEIYMAGLSAWEVPIKPPPCFQEAIRVADRLGVRVVGLDLDETAYTEAYTSRVSAFELFRQGRAKSRLARKRFRASTPQAFVLEWDAEVNRSPGFARLQREREAHMASRLREMASTTSRILAVIEVERAKGVLAALRD